MQSVGEYSIKSAKKIDELINIMATPSDNDTVVDPMLMNNSNSSPPLVYFMGGIICGSIAAVFLVIYMNK